MEDCIIEGTDSVISDEEIVNNWDIKATRKISHKLSVCENEKVLDDVLRDYLWVLQHQALKFRMKKLLKDKIIKHVRVFHLCCIATRNLPVELQSYWTNMESVLLILCNLELDVARHMKTDNMPEYKDTLLRITRKMIYMLSVFLLSNNTRICHVLLKLSVRYDSRVWKDIMKVIYRHFLLMVPVKDRSEENFCRHYLLLQNYKRLLPKDHHEKIDCILYERFNMSRDVIQKSRTLRKILLPSVNSIIDLVDMLTDCRQTAIDNYFKHIEKKNNDDDCIPFSINLESDSEDEVQLTSVGSRSVTEITEIKIEDSFEPTKGYHDSGHVICVDDDSDVEEISLPGPSRPITKTPSLERTETFVSFLDSIHIPGDDSQESSTSAAPERAPTPIEVPPSSSTSNESSTALPFLNLYLDSLKTKSPVLDANVPQTDRVESNDERIEDVPATAEEPTELLLPPADEVPENVVGSPAPPSDPVPKPTKTCEKSVEVATSTDDFHFMPDIITPPISDRTIDDVTPDLNHASAASKNVYVPNITMDEMSFHQFESEMQLALSTCGGNNNETPKSQESDKLDSSVNKRVENIAPSEAPATQDDDHDDNTRDADDTLVDMEVDFLDPVDEISTCPTASSNVEEEEPSLDSTKNLTSVDMMIEDFRIPTEIRENVPVIPITITKPVVATTYEAVAIAKTNENSNFAQVDSLTASNNPLSYNSKIQGSVTVVEVANGVNTKHASKLNGDRTNKTPRTKPNYTSASSDKVIFTSSERVSAPLSVFSKFEQAQSELVENAFSGPLEPLYSYPSLDSDHSNSIDSLHSFAYLRPQVAPKKVVPTAGSPVSPPYEQIQAKEYENHIMSVDYNHLISTISTPLIQIPASTVQKSLETTPKSSIMSRKRKMVAGSNSKKNRVNFGPTEVRIIPSYYKLVKDEDLNEAKDSLKEFRIEKDDTKLVFLAPKVPVKIETESELAEKEEQLKIRGLLQNSTDKLMVTDSSCILKRVDYKKICKDAEQTIDDKNFGHKISNLINTTIPTVRLEPLPSGYVPPVNGFASVHGLQSSNALEQQQTFNNQQSQTSNAFTDNCNSEILNLSISSKLISELDSPESEFSRSPKLLQNSDQIVQQCLIDNLDNAEIEPVRNVHTSIGLLSNNSNFYATPHQLPNAVLTPTEDHPPVAAAVASDNLDKYRNQLDELLLKNELDKLLDDKLINCESEYSLPLKKRRVLPKLNEPYKEEISYPATPMISIAEIEALHQNSVKNARSFKTPAERKEMPPIPFIYNKNSSEPTPIIADQFNINNHTYNNPTINYHMNSVPVPFINVPCPPYYSFPQFIVPFNNMTAYDPNLNQETATVFKKEEEPPKVVKPPKKPKKEKKKQCSSKTKEFFEQYVPDKKLIF